MTCRFADVLTSLGFGLLGGLALAAFIALLGYRRPWKIAGFHNLRMIKVGLAMGWGGFWSTFLAPLPGSCVPFPNTTIGNLPIAVWIALPAILGAVWAVYWDIPFFRKKTGNKAADAVIARYRRAGEIVRAGLPPIRDKDGERYFWIVYGCCGKATGSIAIREADGEVVRDVVKMRYLSRCARMAYAMAYVGELYERLVSYQKGRKALRAWPRAMRNYERVVAMYRKDGERWEPYLEAFHRGLELFKGYGERLMRMWEEEGAWADAHGWEHTPEIPCEEMEALEARLEAYPFLQAHAEEARAALEASRELGLGLQEVKGSQWQRREMEAYIAIVETFRETVELLNHFEKGERIVRFQPWTEEEEKRWRERLQLVEGGKG